MATDPKVCQDGCNSICHDLEGMDFQLHEETKASTYCKTLGGVIDGELGQVRPTDERMWKIISGFEHLLTARVDPLTVQKLLGHAMTLYILKDLVWRCLENSMTLWNIPLDHAILIDLRSKRLQTSLALYHSFSQI